MTQKLTLVILLFALTQCKPEQVKEKYDPAKLIGKAPQTLEEFEKERNEHLGFTTVESYKCDINNDGQDDEIFLEKIKDWTDPGDFHRIRIVSQGHECCFFDLDGLVAPKKYETDRFPSLLSSNKIKSKYIIITQASDKDILLFAFGYTYASCPGTLSIINLSRFDKPEIILSYNYDIYQYKDLNGDAAEDMVATIYLCEYVRSNDQLRKYYLQDGYYTLKDYTDIYENKIKKGEIEKILCDYVSDDIMTPFDIGCEQFERMFSEHQHKEFTDKSSIDTLCAEINRIESQTDVFERGVDTRIKLHLLYKTGHEKAICISQFTIRINNRVYETDDKFRKLIQELIYN